MGSFEKDAEDTWGYVYAHEKTEATTGYYTCAPEEELNFAENLRRLAERPLDSFLHQKLLRDLGGRSQAVWLELADCCLEKRPCPYLQDYSCNAAGVLACLLLECARLMEKCASCLATKLDKLKNLGNDWSKCTPLPLLVTSPEVRRDNKFYSQAIDGLWPIGSDWPAMDAGISEDEALLLCMENLESQKGLLRNIHECWPKSVAQQAGLSPKDVANLALERLERAGILHGPEMRHEASLSPIALLRQWRLSTRTEHGRHKHRLDGIATAYGRGMSLAQTRASCLMEIVERASAHVSIKPGGQRGDGEIANLARPLSLLRGSARGLREKGWRIFCPDVRIQTSWHDVKLNWVEGVTATDEKVLLPAQAVFLFLNLDEATLFDRVASTGLASGSEEAGAKLAALTEILERDANATTLYDIHQCFIPQSRDEKIQGLLDDYRAKRIFLYMQDISNESGFPVYRSIVRDGSGRPFYATGAGLDGKKAALSAITETPWPYSWASPLPSVKISLPLPHNLPVRYLEDLPNFSLGNAKADLALLEKLIDVQGHSIAYVNLARQDLLFPVIRAFIADMETSSDYDQYSPPGSRFWARYHLLRKKGTLA